MNNLRLLTAQKTKYPLSGKQSSSYVTRLLLYIDNVKKITYDLATYKYGRKEFLLKKQRIRQYHEAVTRFRICSSCLFSKISTGGGR